MTTAIRSLGDRTAKALTFVTCALALFTTGCLHPKVGPQSLPRDRQLYSISLADSWKELTLLNIVKLRYLDPPVYVDVGNIVSSYTLLQNASVTGAINPSGIAGGAAVLNGGVAFANSPTITYTPLTGNAYIKGLTTPLPPTTVFTIIQNGSPADSILLTSVQSINDLRNEQAGLDGIRPADPGFHRVRELLRSIQLSGAVRLNVKEGEKKQQTTVLTFRNKDVPPDIQAEMAELRRLLHLSPDATEFTLVYSPTASSDTEIAVMTRSIISMLQNIAAEVEVPPEHVAQHRAVPGVEAGRTLPGIVPMIRVHSSKNRPSDAFVSLHYRDTWFWIDDGDLSSKRTFAQLMNLFTMMDTGSSKENLPIVTIPSR
jgi:hypothetical protein